LTSFASPALATFETSLRKMTFMAFSPQGIFR
jgi:hypothetical protein